ncbi:MAG: hypothetical protein PWQ77_720 [Kosmotogales bacterium]|nr:hypothetical protein [Kosmotogales bacterium]
MMKKIITETIKPKFYELNLGEIIPQGWLKKQLEFQAAGLTGKLEEIWEDVGPNSGWLGGDGENWERGPYYCDGLIPLAYLLDDEKLKKKAQKWIHWTLKSQRNDGFFGPSNNTDWWSRMVMLKALKNYYEYTKDKSILDFMIKYFKYQNKNIDNHEFSIWDYSRATENIYVVLWLYGILGEKFLLNFAHKLLKKTKDWSKYLREFKYIKPTSEYLDWKEFEKITNGEGLEKLYEYEKKSGDHHYSKLFEETHIVNVVMALKYPALRYLLYGENDQLTIIKNGISKLMKYHGTVNGMITGDEHLNGNDPSKGTELCAVVEYMFSLEILYRIFGDVQFADILEKIAYNALPATFDKEIMSHQYDQQVNQIMCSIARRDWYNNLDDSNIFALEPNFGCCTANMHQGWPKFAKNLCYKNKNGGIVFGIYGPCSVNTKISGTSIKIEEITDFPFKDEVEFKICTNETVEFPIFFRVPSWSEKVKYGLNGVYNNAEKGSQYIVINKKWGKNEIVKIRFYSSIKVSKWKRESIGIEKGPLVYALNLNESWQNIGKSSDYPEYEVYTNSKWNYALNLDPENPEKDIKFISNSKLEDQPFNSDNPPVEMEVEAIIVDDWSIEKNSAGVMPKSPLKINGIPEKIRLIPYGGARLRIAQFPYIKK